MRVHYKQSLGQMQRAVAKLQETEGKSARIPLSRIAHSGLRKLAQTVATTGTGCGAVSKVALSSLKQALKTVGKDVVRADKNKDGVLNKTEARTMSPLAARLLGISKSDLAPTRRQVSTGCGAAKPAPAPRARRVSTGCGASAPAPRVRSGC